MENKPTTNTFIRFHDRFPSAPYIAFGCSRSTSKSCHKCPTGLPWRTFFDQAMQISTHLNIEKGLGSFRPKDIFYQRWTVCRKRDPRALWIGDTWVNAGTLPSHRMILQRTWFIDSNAVFYRVHVMPPFSLNKNHRQPALTLF